MDESLPCIDSCNYRFTPITISCTTDINVTSFITKCHTLEGSAVKDYLIYETNLAMLAKRIHSVDIEVQLRLISNPFVFDRSFLVGNSFIFNSMLLINLPDLIYSDIPIRHFFSKIGDSL